MPIVPDDDLVGFGDVLRVGILGPVVDDRDAEIEETSQPGDGPSDVTGAGDDEPRQRRDRLDVGQPSFTPDEPRSSALENTVEDLGRDIPSDRAVLRSRTVGRDPAALDGNVIALPLDDPAHERARAAPAKTVQSALKDPPGRIDARIDEDRGRAAADRPLRVRRIGIEPDRDEPRPPVAPRFARDRLDTRFEEPAADRPRDEPRRAEDRRSPRDLRRRARRLDDRRQDEAFPGHERFEELRKAVVHFIPPLGPYRRAPG